METKQRSANRTIERVDIVEIVRFIVRQMGIGGPNFRDMSREGLVSRVQKKNSFLGKTVVEELEASGFLENSRKSTRASARVRIAHVNDAAELIKNGFVTGSIKSAVLNVEDKFS